MMQKFVSVASSALLSIVVWAALSFSGYGFSSCRESVEIAIWVVLQTIRLVHIPRAEATVSDAFILIFHPIAQLTSIWWYVSCNGDTVSSRLLVLKYRQHKEGTIVEDQVHCPVVLLLQLVWLRASFYILDIKCSTSEGLVRIWTFVPSNVGALDVQKPRYTDSFRGTFIEFKWMILQKVPFSVSQTWYCYKLKNILIFLLTPFSDFLIVKFASPHNIREQTIIFPIFFVVTRFIFDSLAGRRDSDMCFSLIYKF